LSNQNNEFAGKLKAGVVMDWRKGGIMGFLELNLPRSDL
jgi:hypothetical protein